MNEGVPARVRPATPAWKLVFLREICELWIWGRALILLVLFSVFLGVMAFLLATNSELDLIPPKEMVFLILQAAIAVGLFVGVLIGTDSFSGERERATLEAMLVTPAPRRHIVLGKFLAAISPWPAALLVSVPYLFVLSQGDPVLGPALVWGAVLGTILGPAFTGFGMLVSLYSNSNKTSHSIGLVAWILCVLPTQFPGTAQAGTLGQLLKKVNPIESTYHFLEKILVNNRSLEELWMWLLAPTLFAVVIFGLLWFVAAPGLRLSVELSSALRAARSRLLGSVAMGGLLLSWAGAPAAAGSDAPETPLRITTDLAHREVKTGDEIEFSTIVHYDGEDEESPPLIVAMNLINLDGAGSPVDPEDWSPERTRFVEAMEPGESLELKWTVHAILDGDFMIYMVAIPKPDGVAASSHPVASSGIHLTVHPFTRVNPAGVLPFVIGTPIVLILGAAALFWIRRRSVRAGGSLGTT